jgi:hypothetical protein
MEGKEAWRREMVTQNPSHRVAKRTTQVTRVVFKEDHGPLKILMYTYSAKFSKLMS